MSDAPGPDFFVLPTEDDDQARIRLNATPGALELTVSVRIAALEQAVSWQGAIAGVAVVPGVMEGMAAMARGEASDRAMAPPSSEGVIQTAKDFERYLRQGS